METSVFKQAVKLLREQKKYRRWLTTFLCLAVLVTLGTVAALKMNGQALNHKKQVLNCQLEVHEHTDACYDGESLICGYADYVVHTHNDNCYDADGELVCQLPEVEAHEHSDDCYEEQKVLVCSLEEVEAEVHEHTEECYIKEKGDLICEEEESDGSEDVDAESDDDGEEDADAEDGEEAEVEEKSSSHEHSDDCYEWNDVLACEAGSGEEGHIHTDECYETKTVLSCGKAELHTHGESCYDEDGSLTCGLVEVKEHIHSEECFETVDMTDEEVAGLNAKLTKTFEDEYVRVTAEYSESAELPKDAVLKVEQITDEEHFAEREAELREELDDENVTMGALMNIGFYVTDEETGKDTEVEPKDAVSITIQFLDDEGFAEGDPITIVHFADEGTEVLDGSKIDKEKATTFEMSSFSEVGVVRSGERANNNGQIPVYIHDGTDWIEAMGSPLAAANVFPMADFPGKYYIDPWIFQTLENYDASNILIGSRWIAYSTDGGVTITTTRYGDNEYGNTMWLPEGEIKSKESVTGIYYISGNITEYVNTPLDQIGNGETFQVVFNPSNGTGLDNYPVQYADNTGDSTANEIPRTTVQISEDLVEEDGKVTIKLPGNSDLNSEFVFLKKDDNVISGTVNGSKNKKYAYKLVGWYNIGNGTYYSVENGSTTAEINLNEKNIFYADWVAANYNFHDAGRDWDVIKTEDTNDFITTRVYDYNDLFNLYSANVEINESAGQWTERWSDAKQFNNTDTNSMLFLVPNNQGNKVLGPIGRPSEPARWNQSQEDITTNTWELKNTLLDYLFPDDDSDKYGVHFVGYGNYLYKHVVDNTDSTENQIGRYVYDSNENAAAYQQNGDGGKGRFYIYKTKEIINSTVGNPPSFLPFNKVDAKAKQDGDSEINYGFGMCSEINFYLPAKTGEDGNKVDGNDMVFNFSGDDDVWVFLDDQELLLDLGGIHGRQAGWINFSTGKINQSGEIKDFSAKKGSHKLTVYYMERGAGLSNCKIEFNIVPRYKIETPEADTVTVKKEWKNDANNPDKPQSVEVALFKEDTQIGDSVILKGDDWSYAWEGLPVGSDYEVREISRFPKYTSSTALTTTDSYDYWAETKSLEAKDIIILNNGEANGSRYALDGTLSPKEVKVKEGIILSESVDSSVIWSAELVREGKYYLKNNSNKYLKLNTASKTLSLEDKKDSATAFETDDHIGAGLCNEDGSYRIIFENNQFSCQVCNDNDHTNDQSNALRVAVYMKQNLSSEVKNYTITNTYTPDITINKVDSDDTTKLLSGAVFKLTRVIKEQGGESQETVVENYSYYDGSVWTPMDKGGEAKTFAIDGFKTLKDLPDADYTLSEISAPTEGDYTPIDPSEPIVINFRIVEAKIVLQENNYAAVSSDGLTLLVKNEKAPQKEIDIRFIKTNTVSQGNSTGMHLLKGAEFKLYQENTEGNRVDGIKEKVIEISKGLKLSDDKGVFYNGKLEVGTYYLQEIKAPDGFELPAGIFKFTIKADDGKVEFVYDDFSAKYLNNNKTPSEDGVYEVRVSNTPGFKLPETGGNGTIPITMGSAILMTVSAFLLYGYSMRHKKRERRSNK